MMNKEDYKKYLELYALYELRNFARKVGVKKPTQMRKEEIIENIIGILFEEKEPIWSIKGRPAKGEDNSNIILPNEMILIEKNKNEKKEKIYKAIDKFIDEITQILENE